MVSHMKTALGLVNAPHCVLHRVHMRDQALFKAPTCVARISARLRLATAGASLGSAALGQLYVQVLVRVEVYVGLRHRDRLALDVNDLVRLTTVMVVCLRMHVLGWQTAMLLLEMIVMMGTTSLP